MGFITVNADLSEVAHHLKRIADALEVLTHAPTSTSAPKAARPPDENTLTATSYEDIWLAESEEQEAKITDHLESGTSA